MSYRFGYIWYDVNEKHIELHRITKEEFEFVIETTPETRWTRSNSTGELMAFGFTNTGRFIGCVFQIADEDTILPITAFDVEA